MKWKRIVISALRKEFLFVVGTAAIAGNWFINTFVLDDERTYAQFHRDQTGQFYARYERYRDATSQMLMIYLNKDKFPTPQNAEEAEFSALVEETDAVNELILGIKTRGEMYDQSAQNEYEDTRFKLTNADIQHSYSDVKTIHDSLLKNFKGVNKVVNSIIPEYEAMELKRKHLEHQENYESFATFLFAIGTVLITVNTFKKYISRGSKEDVGDRSLGPEVTNETLRHFLAEMRKIVKTRQ